MSLDLMSLPVELHLAIQSHLPLPSLLSSRAVCRSWHALIPGTHIPAARLRLLNLYLRAVRSPAFLATRDRVSKNLEDFDRAKLLAALTKGNRGAELPEDFETWLAEWPSKAVFGGIWPGLRAAVSNDPSEKEVNAEEESLSKPHGSSLFSSRRPLIFTQLELVSVSPCPEDSDATVTEMQVAPMWATVPPAKRAIALLLDDAYVNGWQRSNMLVLSSPPHSTSTATATNNVSSGEAVPDITGALYAIDGVKGRADQPLASGWTEFLEKELSREDRWLREHQA